MEDIIPVFIIVILFTNIPNIRLELNMMLDFVNQQGEDYEGEKRSLINLSVKIWLFRNRITILSETGRYDLFTVIFLLDS